MTCYPLLSTILPNFIALRQPSTHAEDIRYKKFADGQTQKQ